jgi:outer membrane lipoprotein-sorting protein
MLAIDQNQKTPLRVGMIKAIFGPLFYIIMLVILAQVMGLRPAAAAPLDQAEDWFNRQTTLQARFAQLASDGSYAEGTFYFKRPHHSRFDYDDPVPLNLITTKLWLHVDDQARRQVTSYPVSETPLSAILDDPVSLRGKGFTTKSESRDGITVITIEHADGVVAGTLKLEFSEKPFELRRWIVIDANGVTTSVVLSNITRGHDLSSQLFVPTNYPNQGGEQ